MVPREDKGGIGEAFEHPAHLSVGGFVAPLGNVSRQDGKVCMRRMPGGVAERQFKPLKGVDSEMHSRSVRVEVGDVDELQHDYLSPESVMP